MKTRNPVVKFMLSFLLVFGLLIIPWPGLEEIYAQFYRAEGQWASNILGPKAIVQFIEGDERLDTQINLANRLMVKQDGTVKIAFLKVGSHSMGYLPISLVIALILATPLLWKRRIQALFGGVILINGFICLKTVLLILQEYNQEDWLGLFILNPYWEQKLNVLVYILVLSGETSLLIALAVWLIVCFRKGDWKIFLEN